MDFKDKVVMITGSARGQGSVHARRFAERGAKLVLCDICKEIEYVDYSLGSRENFDKLNLELRGITRGKLIAECLDIRDGEAVQKLVEKGIELFGRIDILINNAGVCGIKPAWEITRNDWEAMIGVNLTGTWNVCRAVIPTMMEQRYGRIINIGSIAGIKGIPNLSHYSAAKHGVVGLSKALAIDMAPYSVTVNCICPGSVDTDMLGGLAPQIGHSIEEAKQAFAAYHLLPGLIPPEDINELVMWLASDASRSVTGAVWNMDRGWLQR